MLEGALPFLAQHTPQISVQFQVLPDVQVFVETKSLRHISDPQMNLFRFLYRIVSENPHLSFGRLQQPSEDTDRGSLSRPVRSHQAGDGTRVYLSPNLLQGSAARRDESFRQATNSYQWFAINFFRTDWHWYQGVLR